MLGTRNFKEKKISESEFIFLTSNRFLNFQTILVIRWFQIKDRQTDIKLSALILIQRNK
jgi:hypothetical protein